MNNNLSAQIYYVLLPSFNDQCPSLHAVRDVGVFEVIVQEQQKLTKLGAAQNRYWLKGNKKSLSAVKNIEFDCIPCTCSSAVINLTKDFCSITIEKLSRCSDPRLPPPTRPMLLCSDLWVESLFSHPFRDASCRNSAWWFHSIWPWRFMTPVPFLYWIFLATGWPAAWLALSQMYLIRGW